MNVRPPSPPSAGRYRWRILALLFFATTINYMDRSILGVLAPTLQYRVFHWSDADYATINIAFKSAYAIGLVSMGAVIDRVGTRLGYALSVAVWSLFGMLHALVRPAFSLLGFSLARFGLGLGESGNFPASIKTTAEWFPRSERALATGISNSGANVGAILAPLVVPLFVHADGTHWQFAFLTTGVFSVAWIVAWLCIYRAPSAAAGIGAAEVAHIHSDSPSEAAGSRVRWGRVVGVRQTWAFSLAKVTDAVWWFYLFWGGKYLYDRYGLDIKGLALPLVVIYVVSDLGSIAGGWFSSSLIQRGWKVSRARFAALLASALCSVPVVLVTQVPTRFNADRAFYERLGAPASGVPQADQRALRSLEGGSYGSAREFTVAAASAVGADEERRIERALIESARSDALYWIAVGLIALAAAGHQGWSANLYTFVSDVFPKAAVGSVIGFGGMCGALAGLLADWSLGHVLSTSGPRGYLFAFLIAGTAYLFFLGVLRLLAKDMTPLDEHLNPVTPASP